MRSPSRPLTNYNIEEIKKLREVLETLVKPTNTCSSSLALSSTSQAYALSVLQSTAQVTWVVDSGATDHMTHSSTEFISYKPCPSNKKIAIANEDVHPFHCGLLLFHEVQPWLS